MIERQKRRQYLTAKYKEKRLILKQQIKETELFEEKIDNPQAIASIT